MLKQEKHGNPNKGLQDHNRLSFLMVQTMLSGRDDMIQSLRPDNIVCTIWKTKKLSHIYLHLVAGIPSNWY